MTKQVRKLPYAQEVSPWKFIVLYRYVVVNTSKMLCSVEKVNPCLWRVEKSRKETWKHRLKNKTPQCTDVVAFCKYAQSFVQAWFVCYLRHGIRFFSPCLAPTKKHRNWLFFHQTNQDFSNLLSTIYWCTGVAPFARYHLKALPRKQPTAAERSEKKGNRVCTCL